MTIHMTIPLSLEEVAAASDSEKQTPKVKQKERDMLQMKDQDKSSEKGLNEIELIW